MTAVQRQFRILLLLVSLAAGQSTTAGTATVQDVKVVRDGNGVRVEVTLSAPVNASVITASHPDRLVLELPNTLSGARQKHIPVNYHGVRTVRMGLNSANPPITRVVVDLDQIGPYLLKSNGTRITLTVGPAVNARSSTGRNTPAAAASGSLIGIFRRQQNTPPPVASNDSTPLISPPPSQPPIAFPQGEPADSGTTTTANTSSSRPTAAHPNRASLQEGTVFPSLGAPGAGNVPPVTGTTSGGFNPAASGSSQANSTAAQQDSGFSGSASAAGPPAPTVVVPAPQPKAETASANPQPAPVVASAPATTVAAQPPPSKTPGASSSSQPAVSSSVSSNQPVPQDASRLAVVPPTTALVPPSPPSLSPQGSTGQGAVASTPAVATAPVQAAETTDTSTTETASGAGMEAEQEALILRAADPSLRTVFKVKYVAQGAAYLDGGRSSGLTEGMKLEIKDTDLPAQQGVSVDPADPHVVAELEVTAVAETSAVTDIRTPKRPVKPGDLAYLSSSDAAALVQQRALSTTRKYPAVVTFTEGDPLEEEARAEVPKPPLPSVNRARGRIGLDYLGTISHGSSSFSSSDLGLVVRADITRINGTYWDLSGYWRGRINSTSASQQTLQDLINRTYHLSMTYDNPNSAWVAGFGRLYLPWAPSLDTIDGGYFGRRITHGVTTGIFGGSTPDPTSYNYNPDQKIAGAFINFEGGSFDAFHYTSTSGLGLSLLKWQLNRPFVFFENSLSYKRYLSIYDSLQADSPKANPAVPAPGPGLSRNFLTVRVQVTPRVELDFNHNYFRDVPTFDPTLIGTGLLDKYLFQGFSVGARVEVVKHVFVYTDLGRSNRTGDAKNSLNQLYGVTFERLPWFGLRADAHYSRFNSSFGDGSYKSLSLSRNLSDNLRLELLAGQQNFTSLLSSNTGSRFLSTNIESTLGAHYFIQGSFTANRGSLSYDQWSVSLGYRFDSKSKHK